MWKERMTKVERLEERNSNKWNIYMGLHEHNNNYSSAKIEAY